MTAFWLVFGFLILQRILELSLARRNAQRVLTEGGYEVGQSHYPWIVGTHVLFFLGLLIEIGFNERRPGAWFPLWFGLFLSTQAVRYWAILSLGKYWNTRIFVTRGMRPVTRGPYRYIRHPNYVVVVVELLTAPLMFDAYVTAIGITILNGFVLRHRIRVEDEALREAAQITTASA